MRLVLLDISAEKRANFDPVALSRPVFELRCGMTSLAQKLIAKTGAADVAAFVPPYMATVYADESGRKVNDLSALAGDDLLLIDGRVKAAGFDVAPKGASQVGVTAEGEVLYARIARGELGKLKADGIEAFVASAKAALPNVPCAMPIYNYLWDLVLTNPEQITHDFQAAGRSGVEGTVEQPSALRGSAKDVFVGKGALVHPMVVLDAAHGPIYIDEDVEIHPFTRVEGPCYVGRKSILLGAKCREGMSIGPMCRVGGEVEESIIQGYSNKYHDGFLGHAYVGEWVNLGALTTNSDLKNDYSNVSVCLNGKTAVNTGSTKVGALIGDHTKTSIGTLFNTGAYVGAMCLILANGKPLAKHIPSFAWLLDGIVTKGFGKGQLYVTARIAMSRRKRQWTEAMEKMWDAIYELTAEPRYAAIKKGRRGLAT